MPRQLNLSLERKAVQNDMRAVGLNAPPAEVKPKTVECEWCGHRARSENMAKCVCQRWVCPTTTNNCYDGQMCNVCKKEAGLL